MGNTFHDAAFPGHPSLSPLLSQPFSFILSNHLKTPFVKLMDFQSNIFFLALGVGLDMVQIGSNFISYVTNSQSHADRVPLICAINKGPAAVSVFHGPSMPSSVPRWVLELLLLYLRTGQQEVDRAKQDISLSGSCPLVFLISELCYITILSCILAAARNISVCFIDACGLKERMGICGWQATSSHFL